MESQRRCAIALIHCFVESDANGPAFAYTVSNGKLTDTYGVTDDHADALKHAFTVAFIYAQRHGLTYREPKPDAKPRRLS